MLLAGCGFPPFAHQTVKAIVVSDFSGTRKQIDGLCGEVEVQSGNKAYSIWKYLSKPEAMSSCLNCWGAWGRA